MKTLLLIRHAKSGWDNVLTDFERTLTEKGKSDATMMARRLIEQSINIDAFVSSSAKRARQTAEIFMNEGKVNAKKLTLVSSLYEGSVKDFYGVIDSLNDKDDVVALFAHNPGVTDFIKSVECSPVYNMPTCAVYGVKIKTNHWKEFVASEKEFLFFDYLKNTT